MRPSTSFFALALASTAAADLFVTSPVASTKCAARSACNIAWNDDGKTPALKDIGRCTVGLYVGTPTQQVMVQPIQTGFDVSTNSAVSFTPDPAVGESGLIYFIRFTSENLKDATNPAFPHQAFSARFEITGMEGTFNTTVQALVDGINASASASRPATTGATGATSATGAATSKPASTASAASSAQTTASKTGTSTTASSTSNSAAGALAPVSGFMAGVSAAAAAIVGMIAMGL